MKKLIGLSLLLISGAAFAPNAEAKTVGAESTTVTTANNAPAVQFQRNRRAVRTYTRTVRRGRFLYRETYRTTYRPNGRVVTRLVNRVVIRRY